MLILTVRLTDLLRLHFVLSMVEFSIHVCVQAIATNYTYNLKKTTGTYPVAINRDVSPLGNHSLIISVEDDEEFQAQTTVSYFLEEDSKPTG